MHHPTEIQAKEWYKDRRIIAVFQPHTYSRTNMLLANFQASRCRCRTYGYLFSAREKETFDYRSDARSGPAPQQRIVRKTKDVLKNLMILLPQMTLLSWGPRYLYVGRLFKC